MNILGNLIKETSTIGSIANISSVDGLIGKLEEIADSIIFLLSNQASCITGQILTVDGGFTLK